MGRPFGSVARSMEFVPTILADREAELARKRRLVPPPLLAFAGQAALVGTPEQAVARLRPFVAAGCQYFSHAIIGNDLDTLHLLAERVIPEMNAVAAAPPRRPFCMWTS